MTLTVPLKRLIDPVRPITYGIVQAGEDVEGGVPYIRPVDMNGHRGVNPMGLRTTSPEIATAYARSAVQPGDVVVSIGPSFGKTMVVPQELDGANLTQGTARVALRSDVSARFVVWSLQSQYAHDYWETSIGGATFRALNLGPLANTPIRMPSSIEQVAIADYLDREAGRVDKLIEEQQRLIDLLHERRTAVVKAAFAPDPDSDESRFGWLGPIPSEWKIMALKYAVATPITDGPHETPDFLDEGVPFLSAEGVSAGVIDFTRIRGHISAEDEARFATKYKPRRNDIFMVKSGSTTGTVAIVESDRDFNIWSPLAAIRVSPEIDPRYMFWFLSSPAFRQSVELHWNFGTQQNIGMGVLGNLPVVVPALHVQRQIAAALDEQTTKIDTLISETERFISLSQERRAALITAAVTGQIDVSEAA